MKNPQDIPEVSNPLEQPYIERQLVVVTDDAIVENVRNEAIKELNSKNTVDWLSITQVTLAIVLPFGDLVTEAAKEAVNAWSKARASGVQIIPISKSEAKSLVFPPGHPRDGVLYIGHPAISSIYLPMADFHRMVFEHKFSEALNLLFHLGATEVQAEHKSGLRKDFSSSIGIPLTPIEVTANAEAGMKKSDDKKLVFAATLTGTDSPEIPDGLVWYPHEPTWQMIANARLKFGMKNFSLGVVYNDDFGVNAGLKIRVAKTGLDIGGKFEDHSSTEWSISGKFRSST